MERFETKKENLLLLIQYVKENAESANPKKESFAFLAKTFEINGSEKDVILKTLLTQNIISNEGSSQKPFYTFNSKVIPNLPMASKVLDDAYKLRSRINRESRNKRISEKNKPKDVITKTPPKVKKSSLDNFLFPTALLSQLQSLPDPYKGSMGKYLMNIYGKSVSEVLTMVVVEMGLFIKEGAAIGISYKRNPEVELNIEAMKKLIKLAKEKRKQINNRYSKNQKQNDKVSEEQTELNFSPSFAVERDVKNKKDFDWCGLIDRNLETFLFTEERPAELIIISEKFAKQILDIYKEGIDDNVPQILGVKFEIQFYRGIKVNISESAVNKIRII